MARPRKLTPRIAARLVDALNQGAAIDVAANYVGVSRRIVYKWIEDGRAADGGRLAVFADLVDQALASAELRLQLVVKKEAQSNWKAAAWLLERRFPERWGPRRVEVERPPAMSADEYAREVRVSLKAMLDSIEGPPSSGPEPWGRRA